MPGHSLMHLDLMQRYWNATNYLTVGQIYLQENPLLREPLHPEQIKPRLLGHWGTSPGLNFIYTHLNRLIRDDDVNMIYLGVYELVVGRQRKKKGVFSRGRQGGLTACQRND